LEKRENILDLETGVAAGLDDKLFDGKGIEENSELGDGLDRDSLRGRRVSNRTGGTKDIDREERKEKKKGALRYIG